jgi:outer membrane lipoprotein-sorting protein
MKKTVQILFISFVSIGLIVAQNAEKVLEEAAAAYEKSNGIAAHFIASTHFEKQGFSENLEGTIQMRGDKFVLITPDMRTWYDGRTQWTYGIHTDEVYLSTPAGDDLQFMNPMILLRTYKQGYNLSYTGESTADTGRMAHDIRLTSKGSSDVERIEVQIEKASSLPVRMTVFMKNGVRSLIRISKMQTGVNQPDSFFKFNPADYPDAIEIDLR